MVALPGVRVMSRPRLPWSKLHALASLISLAAILGGCDAENQGPPPPPGAAPAARVTSSVQRRAAPGAKSVEGPRVISADSYDGSPAPAEAPAQVIKGIDISPARAEAPGEGYSPIVENSYKDPKQDPLSTFAVDVDTSSYSNVRRFLTQGMLPPKDAVRVEELVNYFPYAYPPPTKASGEPFSVNVEVAACPWDDGHRLARIGLKGREVDLANRPSSNLVFLIDVSGSMADPNKLPLVKQALRLLVSKLGENDRVAIVVYAGASGLALRSTSCQDKATILGSLENLHAGGSTNGGSGIKLAYDVAVGNFIPGGTNRVVLCTDGDFNVGITNQDELSRLIESKARSGVFLSVLGFGMGNYKDKTIERLADKGNGNAAYIDSIREAAKVLVEQMGGTLLTIAKDVKVQVEFNPAKVTSYRLVGYEDRLLKARDFNDDKKDAGEIGAGHTVTALYEIVPAGREADAPGVDPLKYQKSAASGSVDPRATDLFTVKIRFKPPQGDESRLISFPIEDDGVDDAPTDDFRFAAAVAEFALLLRDSPFKARSSWDGVLERAESSRGGDPSGYRREFLELVRKARTIEDR
jgi:Ca-activated chloride channel homolog